jgi:hypothetical protein
MQVPCSRREGWVACCLVNHLDVAAKCVRDSQVWVLRTSLSMEFSATWAKRMENRNSCAGQGVLDTGFVSSRAPSIAAWDQYAQMARSAFQFPTHTHTWNLVRADRIFSAAEGAGFDASI